MIVFSQKVTFLMKTPGHGESHDDWNQTVSSSTFNVKFQYSGKTSSPPSFQS